MNPHVLYLLHAFTPLHVGVDEGLGAIDLPTMRERHTQYPLIPGSSVKGVLREEAEARFDKESDDVLGSFGPPQTRAGDFRGGLVLTDALLLALPVRSLCGTFAWVSCPQIIRRLRRDLKVVGTGALPPLPELPTSTAGRVPKTGSDQPSALLVPEGTGESSSPRVFLEDSLLLVAEDRAVDALAERIAGWYWPDDAEAGEFFRQRFLVVHDDLFGFFVRVGLEVRARVKIDEERGTAAKSGPWTEEHMPAETLLYGLGFGRPTLLSRREEDPAEDSAKKRPTSIPWIPQRSVDVLRNLGQEAPILRFGGHATIGLGRARFRVSAPESSSRGGDR